MTHPHSAALMAAFFLCLSPAFLAGSPIISEFLAENDTTNLDEDGEASDWIELSNRGGEAVDLEGYSLTDDPELPHKWLLPQVSLAPEAYLLIFASGKDRRTPDLPLHTNFSIDGAGEFLALYAPGSEAPIWSFAPEFPEQFNDVAYGISVNNPDDIGYLLTPTPNGLNDLAALGLVDDTQFSVDRGFYLEPITVSITTPTEDATIYYTLDGSEPSEDNHQIYTDPLVIETTTILRAMAVKEGFVSSNVDTQTYLFASDVKDQFTMDTRVTEAPEYEGEIEEALGGTLPALSIVVDDDLFFGANGIHTEFGFSGREAEVPISLEYFSPTDAEDTFHLRAGIRIHGGNARFHPKKPFRLYFREEYSGGSGELEYPLFEGSNVDRFEQLVLRSGGHDSWSLADDFGGRDLDLPAHASFLRDQFLRQTENDMGLLSPLGKYVHVYINGIYWGVYDLHERPNAAYFSDHLGGAKADWDVVHHPEIFGETYTVVNGNAEAWEALQSVTNSQVADEIGFERIQSLVDLDGYMDSMVVRMWSGDYDWCGPVFQTVRSGLQRTYRNVTYFGNKNWYAGRRSRNGEGKFHFFSWDAEMSMGLHLLFNLFGDTPQRVIDLDLSRVNDPGSPVAPYDALIAYPPFRRAFADRISKHLFNGGELTPEKAKQRLQSLIDQLYLPIIAESARWGNTARNGRVFTRDDDWLPEVEWLSNTFLEQRAEAMLEAFRDHGIYPRPSSPLMRPAGLITEGETITITANFPGSEIYYTTDGTDPAEIPVVENLEVLRPNTRCVWLVPNQTNGGLTSQFRWTRNGAYPNERFWWDGRVGLGYETEDRKFRDLFKTDVRAVFSVVGRTSLYCRVPFSIPSQNALDNMDALILRLRYDDGFVAYINGVRVASGNAPVNTDGGSAALEVRRDKDAIIEEAFDVTTATRNRLVVGSNTLALHGLNHSDDTTDFLLAPRMELRQQLSPGDPSPAAKRTSGSISLSQSAWVKARAFDQFNRWSALSEAYYHFEPILKPGDLAITEIHYRPALPRNEVELAAATRRIDFEFIEILNQRNIPLELENTAFTRGIRFTFPQMQIAPAERVIVVRNQAAFTARYGPDHGARIAGEFERDSRLSDRGENVTLVSEEGEILLSFRYDDESPWPETPDGDGFSLVLRSLAGDPDDPANWSASLAMDGSPGQGSITRYAHWQKRYFATDEPSGTVDGDPDGDALPNLLEYVFGSHPLQPAEKADLMGFLTLEPAGQGQPVFQFLRRPAMEDIQFSLEFSDDLITWQSTDLTEDDLVAELNAGNRERVTITLAEPLAPSGYGRLRATLRE